MIYFDKMLFTRMLGNCWLLVIIVYTSMRYMAYLLHTKIVCGGFELRNSTFFYY